MKHNILAKGALLLVAAAGLASCSSDYLEREPITSVDETTVMKTTDNAQRVLWGICRSMYMGYSVGANVQFLNGESWINTFYGEVFASDAFHNRWANYGPDFMKGAWLRMNNYWMAQMPWMYSYNLINQCNQLLLRIDEATGTEEDRNFIKAQALTLRAHAYTKLLQYYAPRWSESNNGETLCIIIKKEPGIEAMPLSSMKDVMEFVYDDLDTAIGLYGKCGKKDRQYKYEPNIDVARGIYARVAMVKEDWATARQMAHDARANYPIMSADEYLDGFADPNGEWLWCNYNDPSDQYVGFYSWGATYACNGAYIETWGEGAGAINIDLYRQMKNGDVRKTLYWTPDKPLMPPIVPASFWNSNFVDPTDMNMNLGSGGLMSSMIRAYSSSIMPGKDITRWKRVPYGKGDDIKGALTGKVPFGAQFKFWAGGQFSNSSVPFMRGAELAYIEAEAAYRLGDEGTCKAIMDEINKNRGITAATSESGEALLTRMQYDKRIELWGEGFCWTDLKRWRLPMVRRAWVKGDSNSGNIPESYACNVGPDEMDGWRICMTNAESDYNEFVKKFLNP